MTVELPRSNRNLKRRRAVATKGRVIPTLDQPHGLGYESFPQGTLSQEVSCIRPAAVFLGV